MTALIVPTPTHHSALTVEQSEGLMARRSEFGAEDAIYAASIANIRWDGPAVAYRVGDGYVVVEG